MKQTTFFSRKPFVGAMLALAGAVALFWSSASLTAQTPGVGTLSFTDITGAAGMGSTRSGSHGAFWADATGDGLPDLYLTYNDCRSGYRANRFYRNLGGAFVEEAGGRGIALFSGGTHGGSFADLDNDGDYDLLAGLTYATDCLFAPPVGTVNPDPLPNHLFSNDGTGMFTDRTPPSMAAIAGYTRSILAFDLDKDGDLDSFAVNGDLGAGDPWGEVNELHRNEGGFNFTSLGGPLITTPAGQAATDTDYDGDGDVDIIMPDIYGELRVMRNDGLGNFTAVPPASIGITNPGTSPYDLNTAATGITSADLNNDGHLDLILIDQDRNPLRRLGFDRMLRMYLNLGNGTFTYAGGIPSGVFGGYTAGTADLDNDGDLDITLPGLSFVLLNDGAAHFSPGPFYPTPRPDPGCSWPACQFPDPRSVAFADIDNDGDLDSVITTKFGVPALIRNNFNAGNWLKIQLIAPNGQAGAFGAKVRVFRAGTNSLVAFREAHNVLGYLAQDDPVMHVGLGAAATVDVEVTWLTGAAPTRVNGVAANRKIVVTSTGLLSPPGAPGNLTAGGSGFNVTLNWQAPASSAALSGYLLEVGSAPGLTNLAVFSLGTATAVETAAPPGTYYVRIRATNAAGAGSASNEIAVTVPSGCAANAPGTLSYTKSGSLVTLNWGAPTGGATPVAYVLEVGSVPGAANLLVYDTGSPATTLPPVSAPAGHYYVRVRARTSCGSGPASNELVIDVP
jgi:enediyne biosynthesis protein E4